MSLLLPRSVVAALWLPHIRDLGTAEAARRAITGDDEPHVAILGRAQLNWPALVARLAPIGAAVACLPRPGEPTDVPAAVAPDAIAAGECVLIAGPQNAWALIPEVRAFGSALEPGANVTWHVTPLDDPVPALATEPARSDDLHAYLLAGLVQTCTDALATLGHLEPGIWDAPDSPLTAALGPATDRTLPFPPHLDGYRARALHLAARLQEATARGAAQPHPLAGRRAARRATALRDIDAAARRVMSAATFFSTTVEIR